MAIKTKGSGGSIKFSGTGGGIRVTSPGGGGGGGGGITTSGLVLHLDAGNPASYPGSGTTWYDISGNGNNAAAVGSPTYVMTNGGGFNFDSSSDYFDTTPNLRESAATGLTVAAWVKADSFPFVSAIVERSQWNNGDGYGLYQHFSNTIMGPRYSDAQSNNFAVTTGVVYYVAFTLNTTVGCVSKVYINGVQNGSTSTTPGFNVPTSSDRSPMIGGSPFSSGPWAGDIYQVHIYNRDLSSGEMLDNFNGTKSRYGL